MKRSEFIKAFWSGSLLWAAPSLPLFTKAIDKPCIREPKVDIQKYVNPDTKPFSKRLKILVLGGTNFFGPPLVQYALERGHDVTLLNRKITNPYLFPGVKRLQADRLSETGNPYEQAAMQQWDVVIDTWQGNPLAVQESVDALKRNTRHYIYISSIAVYDSSHYRQPTIYEGDEYVAKEAMPTSRKAEMNSYRLRKQLADAYVRTAMAGNATSIRCHAIHGIYEETPCPGNRYWPVRFQRGGDIICPGDGQDYFQLVHVQDAAYFTIHCAEQGHKGIFHAANQFSTMEYMLACKAMSTANSKIHWVGAKELSDAGIRIFTDMPHYVPRGLDPGFNNHDTQRAVSHGIKHRSLIDVFKDDLEGFRLNYCSDYEFGSTDCPYGLSRAKEQEALKKLGRIS